MTSMKLPGSLPLSTAIESVSRVVMPRWKNFRATFKKLQTLRDPSVIERMERDDWARSLTDPTSFYLDCFRYFHRALPADLKAHRRYFTRAKRGFGEDAFHTMWFLLFREFRPRSFL